VEKRPFWKVIGTGVLAVVCVAMPFSVGAAAVERVIGIIDGVGFEEGQAYVWGWACQPGEKAPVTVQVYAGKDFIIAGKAEFASESGVGQACHDQQGKHRFRIILPQPRPNIRAEKLYVRAAPLSGNTGSVDIGGSGTRPFPIPVAPVYPALAGAYKKLVDHPGVFITHAELEDIAKRIRVPDSFSGARFDQLAKQTAHDLASKIDWNATYTGCDLDVYLYAFSFEPQYDYAPKIHAALRLGPNVEAPAGAAVVASRLALYAALVKAGAAVPAGAPSTDQAAALAKRILLAWSKLGLRDEQDHFLSQPSQFCDETGKTDDVTKTAVGLQISRGVVYSAHAQDLLLYLGVLNSDEAKQLNVFHAAMYELIRNSLNYRFDAIRIPCDRYSNHVGSQLTGLLATARLLDDPQKLKAALNGDDPLTPVKLPWKVFFNRAIYGVSDTPSACLPNTGPDGFTSQPSYSSSIVAPGEIDDRFRNSNSAQGIGYSMGTLGWLAEMAELLHNAGFDAYGYRGAHRQSIEMSMEYYACFAKGAGFYKTVTETNSRSCLDAAQYYGKIVNAVEKLELLGAYRFPGNRSITELESAARAALPTQRYWLDAILFGKWRG
jgi:hypothetical protein